MAGHAFWDDDLLTDPEVCSQVVHHGHGYCEPCPGRAVAWYRVGRDYVSRCDSHVSGDPQFEPVALDEVITAWVLEA